MTGILCDEQGVNVLTASMSCFFTEFYDERVARIFYILYADLRAAVTYLLLYKRQSTACFLADFRNESHQLPRNCFRTSHRKMRLGC